MGQRLGQHFLVDHSAADSIVAAAGLRPGDAALEIGPGGGVLTERLLATGARLTAVELDRGLAEALRRRFPELAVVQADFLRVPLESLPAPAVVVANLPYAVATPILRRLLDWSGWSRAVLMFQKEVAGRISAEPGRRDWGLLSLAVRLRAEPVPLLDVGKEGFEPPPKVGSAVVRLVRLAAPRLPAAEEEALFAVARAAFGQRRKLAAKAIAGGLKLERARVDAAFGACGVPLDARAERITLEQYAALARELLQAPRL